MFCLEQNELIQLRPKQSYIFALSDLHDKEDYIHHSDTT